MSSPPPKKAKYSCAWNSQWATEFPWVSRKGGSSSKALCRHCSGVEIDYSNSGKWNLKQHSETTKHKDKVAARKITPSIGSLFGSSSQSSLGVAKLLKSTEKGNLHRISQKKHPFERFWEKKACF